MRLRVQVMTLPPWPACQDVTLLVLLGRTARRIAQDPTPAQVVDSGGEFFADFILFQLIAAWHETWSDVVQAAEAAVWALLASLWQRLWPGRDVCKCVAGGDYYHSVLAWESRDSDRLAGR